MPSQPSPTKICRAEGNLGFLPALAVQDRKALPILFKVNITLKVFQGWGQQRPKCGCFCHSVAFHPLHWNNGRKNCRLSANITLEPSHISVCGWATDVGRWCITNLVKFWVVWEDFIKIINKSSMGVKVGHCYSLSYCIFCTNPKKSLSIKHKFYVYKISDNREIQYVKVKYLPYLYINTLTYGRL